MKNKKLIIFVAVIIIILGGFYFFKKANGAKTVEAVEVENVVVKQTVSASGEVISQNDASLAFPAAGRLEGIQVKKGDKVESGDFLAYIANYDTSQTVQSYKEARDVTKKDLEIYIETYSTNISAAGGEDEYYLNVQRLQQLLNRAEANYQSSLGSLNKTYLYAPFAGTVIDTHKEIGEVVGLGESVIKIADLNNLIFEIEVDQEDFGLLEIGQNVEVILDSHEDVIFYGIVSELPQYADEATDEFVVKISLIQAEENPILLGMNGDASIIIESTDTEVPALTFDTVFKETDGRVYVWVKQGDKAEKEYIEIGLEGDVYTELKTDLSGKEIVIPIEEDLESGSKVKYGE